MTSQEFSDIPVGVIPCNSDLASFTELPKKGLYKRIVKRVVKRGVSLFLPADFRNDDILVQGGQLLWLFRSFCLKNYF